jgi:hypothetical protein
MKPLAFTACAGDVFWQTGAGGVVYCSPEMICDLRQMLFQEALDGSQVGDINLIGSANRMLDQLNTAQRKADEWRSAWRDSMEIAA